MSKQNQLNVSIRGMTCDGCARNIDRALSKKQGIKKNQFPGRKGKQKSVMIQTPSQKRN